MKKIIPSIFLVLAAFSDAPSFASSGANFQRIITVVLENTSYNDALKQPFLASLVAKGTLLSDFHAETHPSQGNYIAMISGSINGAWWDNNIDISGRHIGDLLEEAGHDWRVYAEQFPGNCFLGAVKGGYVRKHNPFISFLNVQRNPARCGKIVGGEQFDLDAQARRLPEYSLYVPDMRNDGHDTNPAFADRWLQKQFGDLLADEHFMEGTLFVVTFDESDSFFDKNNHIFTVLFGPMLKPGSINADRLDHYSLLRLVEDNWSLGSLSRGDASANPIAGIWTK